MKNEVVPVQIRGLLPTNSGCAIFVGNDQKVFVIQVEHKDRKSTRLNSSH